MRKFATNRFTTAKWAFSLVMVGALAACGGGDDAAVTQAESVAINEASGPSVAAALANQSFDFPAVAEFGGTPVKVTLGAASAFTIAPTSGAPVSGTLGFGSCYFKITTSSYVAPHLLAPTIAPSKGIFIKDCDIKIPAAIANGVPTEKSVTFSLNGVISAPITIALTVNPDLSLSFGSTSIPGVKVDVVTGVTGAGS